MFFMPKQISHPVPLVHFNKNDINLSKLRNEYFPFDMDYWSCGFITSRKEWSNLIRLTTCNLLTHNHQKETANTNLSVYIFCCGNHSEIWYNVRFVVIIRLNFHIQCLKEYIMEPDLFSFFSLEKKVEQFLWLDVCLFCCNSGPNHWHYTD